MLYYLIEKHDAKIQALLKEKKFHLKKSLTSLLHQAIQLSGDRKHSYIILLICCQYRLTSSFVLFFLLKDLPRECMPGFYQLQHQRFMEVSRQLFPCWAFFKSKISCTPFANVCENLYLGYVGKCILCNVFFVPGL